MNVDYSKAILDSLKSSEQDWKSRFDDAPLDSVKDLTAILLQITGAVSLLTAFLLFLTFKKGIIIGNS